jgi:hypothetical protein
MSQENQPRQETDKRLEVVLLLVALLIALPAFVRLLVKRSTNAPFPYRMCAGVLGALGAWFLYAHANPSSLLLGLARDVKPLALYLSRASVLHVMLDILPMWERSVLLFPWLTLLIELFAPKSLQETLLAQESRHHAIQVSKSQQAAHIAQKAPDQINGKAVLGVLIDNPNE